LVIGKGEHVETLWFKASGRDFVPFPKCL